MAGATRESSVTKSLVGSTIGNYQITDLLGKGGMATVYRARQESMARDVAVKTVPANTDDPAMTLKRFEQEVQLIAQLQHPRILPVYDFGHTDDSTYLVMRLVETGTLADRLQDGSFGLDTTLLILGQLASALDYAHEHGVVHRDLKPANVFLDEGQNVYLADFGLAKLLERVDTQLTATGYVLGTPAYMSPEQITDQIVDRRTDVYALGLVLFEMLTGHQVFTGSTPTSVIFKHVSEPPPTPSSLASHLTPEIDAVVLKALAKSPDDRYGTAGELATAFGLAVQSQFPSSIFDHISLHEIPGPPAPESMVAMVEPPQQAENKQKWLVRGGLALLGTSSLLAIVATVLVGIFVVRNLLPGAADKSQPTSAQPLAAATVTATPVPTSTTGPATVAPTPLPTNTVGPATVVPTLTPVVEAPDDDTSSPTLEPTPVASPTVRSEVDTATPTVEPTSPPPTIPVPAADHAGRVRFLSVQSRLDTVNLQLVGVEPPPTGKHYEGWLISDTGNMANIGTFAPDENGRVDFGYTDPQGRNMAAIYSGFRASLEPDFGDAPEISGEIVLEGALNSTVVSFVREAVSRSSETPLRSLIEGLETETTIGLDHLTFARNGLAGDNLAGGLNHIEHAVNILVGSADERFGDKNGDGQTQNPGDGYGVLGYLDALLAVAIAARDADPASAELALQVEYLQVLLQGSLQRADGIAQLLERSFIQDSATSTLALIDQALSLYNELQKGFDINGNDVVEPIQGEGGILLVSEHTGYLANIEVRHTQAP